jgi:hypothetical protein
MELDPVSFCECVDEQSRSIQSEIFLACFYKGSSQGYLVEPGWFRSYSDQTASWTTEESQFDSQQRETHWDSYV